jgi:D-aspartate ligase
MRSINGPAHIMKRPSVPLACVMGDTDLLRPLGLAGIPCAVVTKPGAPARFSRFASKVLPWRDAWDHPDELVEILTGFAAAQPEPPVLFYEEDRELLVVSRYRDVLRRRFRFVIADATLVEDLVDKSRFQALASRLGLPVPPAQALDPAAGALPRDVSLRFPLVIKPLTRRTDRWAPVGGTGKAIDVATPAALTDVWPRVAAARLPVLAQELIPGPETAMESYHVYVDAHGETVAEFTGRKIRTHPTEYGHSTALEITDAADVAALGRDLVQRIGLQGVAKLDFKRAPDGRLHLLEINPRFTLWHHPAALAGVNVPLLVYGDLTGAPRPPRPRARAGVRWCKPWQDWAPARAAGVSLWHWLPWALRCEAKRAVSWDDPLPLIGGALWSLGTAVLGRSASSPRH